LVELAFEREGAEGELLLDVVLDEVFLLRASAFEKSEMPLDKASGKTKIETSIDNARPALIRQLDRVFTLIFCDTVNILVD